MSTLTRQPSDIDTRLVKYYPDTNYGTETSFWVFAYGSNNNVQRPIIKFDCTAIPAGAVIVSATLSLYTKTITGSAGRTYWAYKLTQANWTETGATWNKYDGTNTWTTAGGDFVTSNPAGGSDVVPSSVGWMDFSVQAIVQDAVNNSRIVHFLVKDADETATSGIGTEFYSKEEATETTLRPKLYIEYSVAVPLAGISAGTSTVTGVLAIDVPLASLSAGTSTAQASLFIDPLLVGISAGTSTASAKLFEPHQQGQIIVHDATYPRNICTNLYRFSSTYQGKIWAVGIRADVIETAGQDIWRVQSDNEGYSWGTPVKLVDDVDYCLWGGYILGNRPNTDDTTLFWHRAVSAYEINHEMETWYKTSSDGGSTWGSAQQIPTSIIPLADWWYGTGKTLIKQYSPNVGRIILPGSCLHTDPSNHFHSYCVYTDDSTLTPANWVKGGLVTLADHTIDTDELDIVEKTNGDLIGLVRTSTGFVLRTVSTDGGATWSTPTATNLKAPNSITKAWLVEGRLVALFNHEWPGANPYYPRRILALAASNDWGVTWQSIKYIRSVAAGSSDSSYVASNGNLIYLPNGNILTANQQLRGDTPYWDDTTFDIFSASFVDDPADGGFEWPTTTPGESYTNENQILGWHNEYGTVSPSTEQAHSGIKSLKIDPTSSVSKGVRAGFCYPGLMGDASIKGYFYDPQGQNANDQSGFISIFDNTTGSIEGNQFALGVYKSGATGSGDYYCLYTGSWSATSVARSIGWHSFEIRINSSGVTAKIDGVTVCENNNRLTEAWAVRLFGGAFTNPLTMYWDDIELTPVRLLSGISDASSVANASLLRDPVLVGVSAGDSTTSGSLAIDILLVALSEGSSTVSGNVLRDPLLVGLSQGNSTAQGLLDIFILLSGLSEGSSTALATLSIIQVLKTFLKLDSSAPNRMKEEPPEMLSGKLGRFKNEPKEMTHGRLGRFTSENR